MLTVANGPDRRTMLRAGALGLGGLTLADLFRLRAAGAARPERSAIVVWVGGGPSHLETYDLKPDAPSDCRSLYKPTRTVVPGLDVCEFLPRHAAVADKFTLVRSLAHEEADHGFGTRRFCTGYAASTAGNGPAKYPVYECVVNHALGVLRGGMPVAMNLGGFAGGDGSGWRGPGYLGGRYEVPQDRLTNAQLLVAGGRLADRRGLLAEFDRARAGWDAADVLGTADEHRRRAYEVLSAGRVAAAFDLAREDPKLVDRYRRLDFERGLLALRLVKAGVRLVNVLFEGRRPGSDAVSKSFNWDDHAINWNMDKEMRVRLPWYDGCIAALIGDLHDQGLDEDTLLVVTGEFGRTPRLEQKDGSVGRDHWPGAMSVLVAGGGRRRGDVIGGTDKLGAAPVGPRHDPFDFLATLYQWLGIDHTQNLLDLTGRPVPLSPGQPIAGLT